VKHFLEGGDIDRHEREQDVWEERNFFLNKILCWVAIVLPNVLGSTVATQWDKLK
jgi:hypothetical protein